MAEMMALLTNASLKSSGVYFSAIVATLCCIIVLFFRDSKKSKCPLPPYTNSGIWKNTLTLTDGIARMKNGYSESLAIAAARGKQFPFGAVYVFRTLFNMPGNIMVTDYRLARMILQGDKDVGLPAAEKKRDFVSMNFVHRKINTVFTARSADQNRERARKHLAPAFSTSSLSATVEPLYQHLAEIFRDFDAAYANGEVVDMKELLLRLFIRTITRAAFNVEFSIGPKEGAIDALEYLKYEHIAIIERMMQLAIPWRRYMFWKKEVKEGAEACRRLTEIGRQVLHMYKSAHSGKPEGESCDIGKETQKFGGELIISRIANFNYPSEDHAVADILIFILAGHETSAYTFAFFLMHMAQNSAARHKLQEELDAAINPETCPDGRPTLAQVSRLDYLNWCIKESMRLMPVSGLGSGRTMEKDIEYNGVLLPKGRLVVCPFYSIFRQPWIDRAEEFVPERWAEDAPQVKELKDMLMPFSLGPRGCIGMNMANMQLKLLAANFMRYYDFELVEKNVELEFFLTVKPKSLNMRVTPRSFRSQSSATTI
jgi:cytochrome P450